MAETYDTKKLQILDQSKHIFASLGYRKTTMDDIANAVGMKKNSLYYYFENKEALFNAILNREIERLVEGQDKVLANCKNSRQKIEEMVKYALGMHATRSISVRSFTLKAFFEILSFSQEFIEEFKKEQTNRVAGFLREGIRNKEFKKHDSQKLAEYLMLTINALVAQEYHRSNVVFVHEIDFTTANATMLGILGHILDGIAYEQ